ncbi:MULTISPECIES: hypothetical protein [Variovorax]|jgi:hypothetical protein|uniref:hypothetical protein n=1 Tax=Variovorax TaxID=34072 RepID=UPI00089BBFC7|nr:MULTISPECIES: hypothetical protein [Variovorax]MDQ0080742.1 hypothetical protein [Variovorax boronicumulans]SDY68396.1 hypothetical protein SAMN05518854_102265 [Variovorax sp. YR266]SDZ11655.1 hypothetical protein SAMN05518669_121103 [Variovorax sp. YR634]SOD28065.1 hypothetical protein SAMN05518800_3634 [Variovorax sp. YR752]
MNGVRQLAGILWPSFLVACGMEVLVFALVDPVNAFCGADALRMSRQGIYTAAFFVFWLMAASSSACTALLARPSASEPSGAPLRTPSQ